MKSTEIFNGKTFEEVTVGSSFEVEGNWNFDVGTTVVFKAKSDVDVETKVTGKSGLGTEFTVTGIITPLTIDDIINEDSEEISNVEDIIKDEVSEEIEDADIEIPKFDKKKFTKKDLIDYINQYNIDIDIKQNKSKIVSELFDLGFMG